MSSHAACKGTPQRAISVFSMRASAATISLTDGLGVNALARMDPRDVLAQSGVRYVFVLEEGINDLGMLSRADNVRPEDHAALVRNA